MRDMDFLKNLGNELEDSTSGSLINGMTPEEYADSLDKQTEEEPQAFAGTLPAANTLSDMGGPEDALPTTEISDMYETPPENPYAAGMSTNAPTGAQISDMGSGLPQTEISDMGSAYTDTSAQSAAANRTDRQYSANSYGNSQFVTAGNTYQNIRDRRATVYASNENIGLGTIGAILGAALGTGIWAAISYAGYISGWGALAIVAGTFFGYLLFAKDIGRGGALVVGVLIILAVYCGNRLGYALDIHSVYKSWVDSDFLTLEKDESIPTVFEIFRDFKYHMDILEQLTREAGIDSIKSEYNSNMGLSYVYTAVASIIFFRKRLH